MKIEKESKIKRNIITISFLLLLFCCFLADNEARAYEDDEGTREYMSEYISVMEDMGAKRTEDGFFYTMNSNVVIKGLKIYRHRKGISEKTYEKLVKKYKGKKNCCYILSYLGNKTNIRLPEEIEGCRKYVLCFGQLYGIKKQVKKVTIPSNVRILSVLQDNPIAVFEDASIYMETAFLRYNFMVEEGNQDVESSDGLLYSKNGKILYGIPIRMKGKLVVPDNVERVYISGDCLKLSEIVLGKNVSQIFYENYGIFPQGLKKVKVKKGNRYFRAIDNTLYSKNMKKLYFSVSKKKGTYRMPDSVKIMGNCALSTAGFSIVITSEQLKKIPENAFNRNTLKELTIGKSVSEISETSIYRNHLKRLYLDKNNPYFTIKGQWLIHTQSEEKDYYCGSYAEVIEK